MKKLGLLVIALFMVFITPVNAKKVETLTITQKDGKISVSGTFEDGALASQIIVYDEAGTNKIIMVSTDVASDNTFKKDITLAAATYTVKVADYDGGELVTLKVADGQTATYTRAAEPKSSNPATNDHLATYIAVGTVSLVGITAALVYLKKKKTIKNN